jgi:hypothetical protein
MGESIRLTLWILTFTPSSAATPTDGYTYVYTDVHITITSLSYIGSTNFIANEEHLLII